MLNNRIRTAVALAGAALLAACQQSGPALKTGRFHVKPELILIPADQAHHHAREDRYPPGRPPPRGWEATDVRSVQTDPVVSAIQFNRYADPGRPRELMHEAHVVYRRETGPRWRLRPATAAQQILIGPALTDGRGEVQPLQSAELDAYVREQRANSQRQQDLVLSVAQAMQRLASQQEQLAEEIAVLKSDAGASRMDDAELESEDAADSRYPSLPD